MKKFEFTKSVPAPAPGSTFSGEEFYNIYKDSEFLRHDDHIETILSKGYELRQYLRNVKPGERVAMPGMWLEKNSPLQILKTSPHMAVEDYEFTANRLCGLVAAYAFENRHRFPVIQSYEAKALGLIWKNDNTSLCRIYLSAVKGSEHFYDQFLYWPLVCALRKLELKKIPLEQVINMAKTKNKNGVSMGQDLMSNLDNVKIVFKGIYGHSSNDLKSLFHNIPAELKKILVTDAK